MVYEYYARGVAWRGKARRGEARHGLARRGLARQGEARRGKAGLGWARSFWFLPSVKVALDGVGVKMEKEYRTREEKYLEETKPQTFKIPVGESYLEFLGDGEEQDIKYAEGDVKRRMVYAINAFDKHGQRLAEGVDFAMPRTLLDAVHELRLQKGETIVGGWLKVKREGSDKLSTRYQAYPTGKPVW